MDKPTPPKYIAHDCYDGDSFIADNMKELKEWVEETLENGYGIENIKVFEIGRQLEVSKTLIIK